MIASTHLSAIAATFLALSGSVHAAAIATITPVPSAVCNASPYQQFLPLSTFYLANLYCSSAYPVIKACTSTTTTTARSTTTIYDISRITEAPVLTTVTTGSVAIVSVTVTTTFGDEGLKKREAGPAATVVPQASLAALFQALEKSSTQPGLFKTVCGCIQKGPTCKIATATASTVVTVRVSSDITTIPTSTITVDNTGVETETIRKTLYTAPVTVTVNGGGGGGQTTVTVTGPTITAPPTTSTVTATVTVTETITIA